ncbi:hypothetical protein FQZ97_1009070 [compost metagenome]
MQHAGAITARLIQVEQTRQGPGVFSRVQRQVPITLGVVRQTGIAEPGTAFERQPQNQVHALSGAESMQRLRQGLHGGAMVLRRAVGGGNEYGGDLRVGANFIFQQRQIKAVGVEAAFDCQLHVGH